MIVSLKCLPLTIAIAQSGSAKAKQSALPGLRGHNRRLPGTGNGSGKLKKLDAEGCTVLEKANLGPVLAKDGDSLPYLEEVREFACEEVSTGHIYRIEDDLIDISRGNKSSLMNVDDDADIIQSAQTLFLGDADINDNRGTIKFNRGRFGKVRAHGKGGNPDKGGGRTLQSVGSPTVLALNVISSEQATTGYDNAHLADSVFGSLAGGSNHVSLASQFAACSHGKLRPRPLPDETSGDAALVGDVSDGVATVHSTVSTASGQRAMREDALSKLRTAHGIRGGADFVMVCLPDASMGFSPYAFINHYLSVYPHRMCTNPSVQLHELGHNLGLGHSGEGSNSYGDGSGFMGSGGNAKKCFNGPKNWQLGWFSDRHVTLAAGVDSFSGRLYGTTQYDNTTSSDKMMLRLHDTDCATCDYYLSFNHDASYNSGTQESKNQVQVHTKEGTPGQAKESRVVARLGGEGSYSYTATINGIDMTIAVSSVNAAEGWAEIIVAPGASAPPTTAAPTPAPGTGNFYTACGSSAGTCSNQSAPVDVNESRALRCCADSQLLGFVRHSSCPFQVWSESKFEDTCYHGVTWNEGRSICASYGARLCTKEELLADCSRGTGCSHDQEMIWSSTEAVSQAPTPSPTVAPTHKPTGAPSDLPSIDPTLSPTSAPSKSPANAPSQAPTPLPTPSPAASYNFLHKIVCGATHGYCKNSPTLLANVAETHSVRCCSDTAKDGWVKKSQCRVWGESELPSCNAAKTYAEAESICAANNARICTEAEIKADCTRGSGCGFSSEHNWSSTTVPKCTDDSSCDDGLPCTSDTCGADGKCVNKAIGCGKIVACGSTANNCVAPYVKGADPGELHEVRCCSDVAKSGWVKQALCTSTLGRDVWGQSNGSLGSCSAGKTYAEAEAICLAGDSRLCTSAEVRADCTKGSGCSFDWEHVWTSDDNIVSAEGGDVTATEAVGVVTMAAPKMNGLFNV